MNLMITYVYFKSGLFNDHPIVSYFLMINFFINDVSLFLYRWTLPPLGWYCSTCVRAVEEFIYKKWIIVRWILSNPNLKCVYVQISTIYIENMFGNKFHINLWVQVTLRRAIGLRTRDLGQNKEEFCYGISRVPNM
jgi:hypothetical protein